MNRVYNKHNPLPHVGNRFVYGLVDILDISEPLQETHNNVG